MSDWKPTHRERRQLVKVEVFKRHDGEVLCRFQLGGILTSLRAGDFDMAYESIPALPTPEEIATRVVNEWYDGPTNNRDKRFSITHHDGDVLREKIADAIQADRARRGEG